MNDTSPKATVKQWVAEPIPKDVATALDRLARSEDVRHVAIMPDVHLAKEVCTGTVIGTDHLIYPSAVGSDIGCGMAAVRFDCAADLLATEQQAAQVLAALYRTIPAMRHGRATMIEKLPDVLTESALSDSRLETMKRRDARVQFATLGRGNHFLEFQRGQDGALWLMVHSGSRAIGQAISEHHLRHAAQGSNGLRFLEADSEAGRAYVADHLWACSYAEMSRRAMLEAVATFLEQLFRVHVDWSSELHCNHNHVRRETHLGSELWVHRKGAVSAHQGEPGIIPGSMGTVSFHVEGRGLEDSLCSSSHGAGRRMSRAEAFSRIKTRHLLGEMKGIWFDQRMASRLCDEAPSAYKDIRAVMRAQRELTRTVRQMFPVLNYKGG